jgi:hypothetical protein
MKTIAYSSPFVPAEWIAAHGLRPQWLRLPAASGRPLVAATRGVCPYAGALIDAAIWELDASALVLTTVCDQMRYAAALLQSRGSRPVFLLNVPSTWQTAAVQQLYLDELRRLGQFLVQLGGESPGDGDLARVMLAYDRARLALCAARGRLSARQFAEGLAELRGPAPAMPETTWGLSQFSPGGLSQFSPGGLSQFSPGGLSQFSPERKWDCPLPVPTAPPAGGIPLAVLGGPLLEADYALFDLVEETGGRVVLDGTEGGERTLPAPFDPAKVASDPLPELADAYFGGIPDAFRRPNSALYEWLGRELAARQVRGIVFRRYVWCDLWHAELQRLKQFSPVPVLEIDAGPDDTSAQNRLQGRIEAFLEMLLTPALK